MGKWIVNYTDNESPDEQTASFSSKKAADLWILNQRHHSRYDANRFEVVDGPYDESKPRKQYPKKPVRKLKLWIDKIRPAPKGYQWIRSVMDLKFTDFYAGLGDMFLVDVDAGIDDDGKDLVDDGLMYIAGKVDRPVYVRFHGKSWKDKMKVDDAIKEYGWRHAYDSLHEDLDEDDTSSTEGISQQSMQKKFDDIVDQYAKQFGIDLSYMKFVVDTQPVYNNGEPCYEYSPDECGGDWTKLGWIRLNPDMKSVMDRYGVKWHNASDIDSFARLIIAHELAHEAWNNIVDDQFKQDILDKAHQANFTSEYLKTVKPSKLDEETFCEYLAHLITQQKKDILFPEEELQDLSRRKHIVTHRVSDDLGKFNKGDVVMTPWGIPYRVSSKRLINDISQSPYIGQLTQQQVEFLKDYNQITVIELDAVYEPPYTLAQIKANYPEKIYKKLSSCPIHSWRAKTGIELIHQEPDEEELDRIWKNWQLMPQKLKDISDKKSLEMFGMTNAEHYKQLKPQYRKHR